MNRRRNIVAMLSLGMILILPIPSFSAADTGKTVTNYSQTPRAMTK